MKKLTVNGVANVRYTKSDNSSSERTILPLHTETNIRALDVTKLSESEIDDLRQLYATYLDQQTNFISWLHDNYPNQDFSDLKWRVFKPENLEIL